MNKHTPGPWNFRLYSMSDEDIAMLAKLGRSPVRMLDNDGSASVTSGSMDEDTVRPVARVLLQKRMKRGDAWRAEDEERDANARLIAAAPDLLAALKMVERDYPDSDDCETLKVVSAAIAKAEGK